MNTNVHHWQVQIRGSASDLEYLARHFTSLPALVVSDQRDCGYLYESAAFAACTSSQEILAIADQELAVLSGVLKLARGSHEVLRSGVVYRSNEAGGQDAFVHIREALQLRVELGEPTVTVTDANGNVVTRPKPPPKTLRLAQLAGTDTAVSKALRLHAEADSTTWVGLYRIYEVIEADVGGQAALTKRDWISTSELKRFKHSANSIAVAGDKARHGKEVEKPPKHPMSRDEAEAYVGSLLHAWLAAKGI